eukprot:3988690-Amphidinium_carterae.1
MSKQEARNFVHTGLPKGKWCFVVCRCYLPFTMFFSWGVVGWICGINAVFSRNELAYEWKEDLFYVVKDAKTGVSSKYQEPSGSVGRTGAPRHPPNVLHKQYI